MKEAEEGTQRFFSLREEPLTREREGTEGGSMRCLQSRGRSLSWRPYLGALRMLLTLLFLFEKMPSRVFASGSIAPFRHLAISHLALALFSSFLRCTVGWRSRAFRGFVDSLSLSFRLRFPFTCPPPPPPAVTARRRR